MQDQKAVDFLQKKFSSYYKTVFVDSVPEPERREFGYGVFGKKIIARHLSFSSAKEFNSFLREQAPFFVSYSPALYEFPENRPMERKNFIKSDLIYEFDADDIKTSCKEKHDSWKCLECRAEGKGLIEKCPSCGNSVETTEWVCENCLEATKKQSLKLIGILEEDFGFDEGISVNFSGSKGFHIHIKSEKIQDMKQSARIELLDFLTAKDLDLEELGFVYSNKKMLCPKEDDAFGWSKKLLSVLRKLIEEDNSEKISALGNARTSAIKKLLEKKDLILKGMQNGFLFPVTADSKKFWNTLLFNLAESEKLFVDRQTSMDLAKIIRVPNTIHGSTGLLAVQLKKERLKEFNALNESIIFSSNPLKIFVEKAPEFTLGSECFGPFNSEQAILPEFAAVYLLARNSAKLVG
ncbi:MAG: DNA primase small subunit domain-containing protein [archaeon]